MFIFVKVSNLIFFKLTWKRNWSENGNPLPQEICSERYSGKWSQFLCHSSHYFSMAIESELGLWLLWPIEYFGSDAIPILSLAFKRTSSFYFLLLGIQPPHYKEAQAATQQGQQEGRLRPLANSHKWTPANSQHQLCQSNEGAILEVTPPAPVDTRCSRDKLSLLWALPKLPHCDQRHDCCVLSH